ncbi:uncharacterized protein BYT42DRAFT_552813 [Radiomyces spectabilis]|uniref:uncharacterized protein n=1 Tax=Radiomyces spectabilis TaxID=64574 RepID=UPI00221EADFE|nr:uncharacterized protein BYT42DRAFT_552813 [Radiomyces spectabilis]KAI8393949.1 hypothetical protein BYT42DRAFT_552813 [Radiomyces spectabilis]
MAKRCCCIIPLRPATLLISLGVVLVAIALLGLTFTHKNPMVMHLSVVHAVLPWVYIIVCAVSAVVGLYGILASAVGKLGFIRLYKLLFWLLTFLVVIWQAVIFVLALVNRSKTLDACQQSNPDQNQTSSEGDKTVSVGGYSSTFLGMQMGDTYGLANCGQAVQAGVIGIAILLFVGGIAMFYFATVIGSYARTLRERSLGHRLRDAEWDDNLDDLAATYRADARNAPKYPLKNLNQKDSGNKFTKGLKKFGLKK